jgi:hypothetical protein
MKWKNFIKKPKNPLFLILCIIKKIKIKNIFKNIFIFEKGDIHTLIFGGAYMRNRRM